MEESKELVEEIKQVEISESTRESFKNLFGTNLRIYGTEEKPLFVGVDICKAIGIDIKSRLSKFCQKDGEEGIDYIKMTLPGRQSQKGGAKYQIVLSEQGVYSFLALSRTEKGKEFRKLISDLLHNLRIGKLQLLQQESNAKIEEIQQQLEEEKKKVLAIEQHKKPMFVYEIRHRGDTSHTKPFYIGSTCQQIQKRYESHQSECKRHLDPLNRHVLEVGYEQMECVLLETHYCLTNKEIEARENELIGASFRTVPELLINKRGTSQSRSASPQSRSTSQASRSASRVPVSHLSPVVEHRAVAPVSISRVTTDSRDASTDSRDSNTNSRMSHQREEISRLMKPFDESKYVRKFTRNNVKYYVARDAAAIMDCPHATLSSYCKENNIRKIDPSLINNARTDTLRGNTRRYMYVFTERELFAFLVSKGTKLVKAREYKDWFDDKVLELKQ